MDIRKSNKAACGTKITLPNYVPYKELAETINGIDIGTLNDVSKLCSNPHSNPEGSYRDAASYILLANFYLKVDKGRADKLKTFINLPKKNADSFLFVIAIGCDGAPGSGTAVLVSFLNCGKRVASSSENYLLFGANVDEGSEIVQTFFKQLVIDLKYLESKCFDIQGIKVEFMVGELPNDLKMMSVLAGELPNSAIYFITFANVSKDDCNNYQKKFGSTSDCQWKPWSYGKRLSDAEKVFAKKKEIEKGSFAKVTARNKFTTFISTKLKSRQEFEPLIDTFLDRAKAEPLHLKNNTIKEQFMKLLKIAMALTNFGKAKSFNDVCKNTVFVKFAMFHQLMLNFALNIIHLV